MSVSKASRSARISWAGLLILPMLAPLAWAEPTQEELEAASLLASRATFGMTYEQIVQMAEKGLDEWLDEQLEMECTPLGRGGWEERLFEMYEDGEFDEFIEGHDINLDEGDPDWEVVKHFGPFRTSWYMTVLNAPDQLCQRVAWALSQIFVIHTRGIDHKPYSHTSYYDILLDNAFGNYRELIEDVTYSNQMGRMLSHVNNSRSRPEENRFPDQNYAREIMQLFSIGLFELNVDGTPKQDDSRTIPTYDANDISNLARVMTGFAFDGEDGELAQFDSDFPGDWWRPMTMMDDHHDKDEKVILGNTTIPAGQSGYKDVNDALDVIFEHENVGPFIGRQLIQRLVTSNPEPGYIQRVAEAFNDDGLGVRGNLKHVVKTILTDPEAKDPVRPQRFGKLREPVLRMMNLHRMFPLKVDGEDTRGLSEPFYHPEFDHLFEQGNQEPLNAPSVFNFYSPFHSPIGDLSDNEMVAPEFRIFNMRTAIEFNNQIWRSVFHDDVGFPCQGWDHHEYGEDYCWHPKLVWDFSAYFDLAETPSNLVDRLDLLMVHGSLISTSRTRFIRRIEQLELGSSDNRDNDLRDRVTFSVWYMSTLPDYVVETY